MGQLAAVDMDQMMDEVTEPLVDVLAAGVK